MIDTLSLDDRRFHAVFVGAADAMLILDDGRRVVEANPSACALFGLRTTVGLFPLLDDCLADHDNDLATAWGEVLSLGEARREHRVVSAAKGARLLECSYRARVQGGNRHLCIARDITERRRLEERLMQSEKTESVGRLAGGIAHDFNNLLTAILGYTELLLAHHGSADDPDRADLEEIQKAGQRAAALTQQLLAYSRKQMLQPKEVDLNHTIANLQNMLARLIREDIALTCDLSPAPALIRIDPTQLEQVILNLVLNARDALPFGGSIQIGVKRVPLAAVEVPPDHASHSAEYIRLRVEDNGVGIPAETRRHVFEPFFTTKEVGQGTGLGLASVYGIVRQSNGFITVDSEPGRGTIFTMHFPALATVSPGANPAGAESAGAYRETILLVEDEDSVRAVVSAVLRRQGYHVLEAANPRAARDIFAQHGATVDLLLSDVVMPGMNGPALADSLTALKPDLQVLFISGYADLSLPLDAEDPRVSFLSKPFQATVLTAKVRDALSRRPHATL